MKQHTTTITVMHAGMEEGDEISVGGTYYEVVEVNGHEVKIIPSRALTRFKRSIKRWERDWSNKLKEAFERDTE